MFFFFSIWLFLHDHSWITGLKGKGDGISLIPYYHFHLLHRHLDISREITTDSSPLRLGSSRTESNWEPLVFERKSLTSKPRAPWLYVNCKRLQWLHRLQRLHFFATFLSCCYNCSIIWQFQWSYMGLLKIPGFHIRKDSTIKEASI